ncbi:hypothetical protein [Niveibacterium sp.]|uniref:hypothetical protein n=1 Tax=Niveibacterium sp. TaxID=2017444 RepID=UPI0035B1E2D6
MQRNSRQTNNAFRLAANAHFGVAIAARSKKYIVIGAAMSAVTKTKCQPAIDAGGSTPQWVDKVF